MKTEVGKHNGIKYLLFRDRIGNQQGHSYKGNPWKWFLYAGTNSRDGDCYVGDFDRKADAYAELDARSNPDHPFHPHGHDFNVHNHGMNLVPYNPARFDGSAASYAGQGVCSKCHTRAAEWMNKKATRAYCDNCKPKELT